MIIIHRVNKIEQLKNIPLHYGVEIDVRMDTTHGHLYLSHDPVFGDALNQCDFLHSYLSCFNHAFIVVNIKEAGTELAAVKCLQSFGIDSKRYFLLDVEFPFLYRHTHGVLSDTSLDLSMAVRFSEAEPIEQMLYFKYPNPLHRQISWVWIDTQTQLPIDVDNQKHFQNMNTCLVCPERWGRPDDIKHYIEQLKSIHMTLTAVMTSLTYASLWESSEVI